MEEEMMKKFALISLLTLILVSCQKEEDVASTPSTESQTECAQSAQKAKEALETKSEVAFDLSGSKQTTGCTTGKSESEFEL
jgi:PBP1b-binding outer membrane lipoprotein LpoB